MIYRAAKDENGKWPVTPFAHIATTFSVEQRGGSLGTDNREDLTEGVVGSLGTHDRGLLFKLVYKWMVLNIHGQRENACKVEGKGHRVRVSGISSNTLVPKVVTGRHRGQLTAARLPH